jgi:hypothetical protein
VASRTELRISTQDFNSRSNVLIYVSRVIQFSCSTEKLLRRSKVESSELATYESGYNDYIDILRHQYDVQARHKMYVSEYILLS